MYHERQICREAAFELNSESRIHIVLHKPSCNFEDKRQSTNLPNVEYQLVMLIVLCS